MPRVVNNNILAGVSGKLGNNIVIRQSARGIVMANKPKKRSTAVTESQLVVRDRFQEASFYAREQTSRPESLAIYKTGVTLKLNSAYLVAVSDYLKKPRITAFNASAYSGAVGDLIKVRASDDFRVVSVTLVITAASGEVLERGEAVFTSLGGLMDWIYTTKVANPSVAGTTIAVIATDLPGNETSKTYTL
ncbi:hypothetical protein WBG78_29015 [Chryseolinea sp. T2]|uniref:hypothetical protein n=1 Tax=Chryseolinea sp. T2 TaxID=3129255 RepID=UPI00307807A8